MLTDDEVLEAFAALNGEEVPRSAFPPVTVEQRLAMQEGASGWLSSPGEGRDKEWGDKEGKGVSGHLGPAWSGRFV